MRYLEWLDSQRQKAEWWLSGAGGRAEWELQLNRLRVSVCKDEKLLELDGGHGCAATWTFLAPLNCALRNVKFYAYFTTGKKKNGIRVKWKLKSLFGEEKTHFLKTS